MLLRVGVLSAGSLDWRNESYRADWRKSRLIAGIGIPVKTPIRYGRLSKSNTYTMVFAPACPDGQAKVRLCSRPVSSIADLVEEAKALWLAERPAKSRPLPGRTHSADWGCVALLANPKSTVSQKILGQWAKRVSTEKDQHGRSTYDSKRYAVKGISAIDQYGVLQIAWPLRADTGQSFDSCDLLIATATLPTPDPKTGDFPTADVIAEAWNNAGDAQYFHMNRSNGICTFQDEDIQKSLDV